jgi:hypothetical protein
MWFYTPLDGILLHADTLCVIRYSPQELYPFDQGIGTKERSKEEEELKATRPVLPLKEPVLQALVVGNYPDGLIWHPAAVLPAAPPPDARSGTTDPTTAQPNHTQIWPQKCTGTTTLSRQLLAADLAFGTLPFRTHLYK